MLLEKIYQFSYPIFMTGFFLALYLISRFKILSIKKKRLKSLKRRNFNDAIEITAPEHEQLADIKLKGLEGLEGRFGFINKSLPVLLLIMWAVTVSVPYLGKMPSVYITILTAITSVVIGISLRPFLENLFSGIIIAFFRSIRIGDTVIIDGHYGLLEEIGLTYSMLKRWDSTRIIIPNARLINKEIENLTITDQYIWAHVEFHVAPDADIGLVEEIATQVASQSKFFLNSEPPSFWVMELGKDSIKCWIAAWSDNPMHAWELRNDIRTNLAKRLQASNIQFQRQNFSNFTAFPAKTA